MSDLQSPARPPMVEALHRPGSPLRTWPGTPPHPLTSLVGRQHEIDSVASLLRRDDVRTVTLLGPGGVGKTRVGTAVAASVSADFADGVAFVDLSPIRDQALVVPAIAAALGAHEGGDQSIESTVASILRDRRILVLLDNCEQVEVARHVAWLLGECPHLKVLATSRNVLRVTGEQVFPIPPLANPPRSALGDASHPPVEDLLAFDAVSLFVQRAQAVDPSFALSKENAPTVAAICNALDGLPLAIELAAARLRLLSPDALLARLRGQLGALSGGPLDKPNRLQTMRAAIAWSYDLLSDGEQRLFRRLAVFDDGFTIEAAEDVASEEAPASSSTPRSASALDIISSLLDHSLVARAEDRGQPRFRMLETIRAFGLEQLDGRGEAGWIRQRHAAYFLRLAELADQQLTGPDQNSWLDRLETEQGNLRAALEWAVADEPETAIRLAAALGRFWWTHGHLVEGRRWLGAVLDRAGGSANDRARTHYAAGSLAGEQGDYPEAIRHLEAALAGFRETADALGEALVLTDLGLIARDQGDLDQASTHHLAALALRRGAGDRRGIAVSLSNLGALALIQGDFDRAGAAFTESVETFRSLQDHRSLATAVSMLSDVAMRRGDFDSAVQHADEALRMMRPLGDQAAIGTALTTLAGSLRAKGLVAAAETRYEESLAIFRDLGHGRGAAAALSGLASARLDSGESAQAAALLGESLDLLGPSGDRYLVLLALEEVARLAMVAGKMHRAARLIGSTDALRGSLGAPRSPSLDLEYLPVKATVRASMDAEDWEAERNAGAGLSLAAAYQEAAAICAELAHAPSLPSAAPERPISITGDLTPREREVLQLLTEGRTDREIAAVLFVTTKTASNHVASILSKLGVETRTAAAALALRQGLT